jgi:hypothetical protein
MKVKLLELRRENNSMSGNPRWRLFWEEVREAGKQSPIVWTGTGVTKADASFNYDIGNEGLRVGDVVDVLISVKTGRVIDIQPVGGLDNVGKGVVR